MTVRANGEGFVKSGISTKVIIIGAEKTTA
jgi:hypothetical protein